MDPNRAAQEVTVRAAQLQHAVATGEDVMHAIERLAYVLGDVIENTTGRKFAGLDMERAVKLIVRSPEDAEFEVRA